MQQVRPKSIITPLQLGLAAQMHRHFGSRFLIDSLHKHGFCVSYSEVLKYGRSAAKFQGTEIPGLLDGQNTSEEELNALIQAMADNVDHNLKTIDGKNTFHGMGIIMAVTPRVNTASIIPRLKDVSTEEIIKLAQIELQILPSFKNRSSLEFDKLSDIVHNQDPLTQAWCSTWLLNPKQPLWGGYMQMVTKGSHPGAASIFFMKLGTNVHQL
jgi:hypothetical protein